MLSSLENIHLISYFITWPARMVAFAFTSIKGRLIFTTHAIVTNWNFVFQNHLSMEIV